jgi:hypothetical protein
MLKFYTPLSPPEGADASHGKEMTKPHEKTPKRVSRTDYSEEEAIKRQEKWTKKGYVAGGIWDRGGGGKWGKVKGDMVGEDKEGIAEGQRISGGGGDG